MNPQSSGPPWQENNPLGARGDNAGIGDAVVIGEGHSFDIINTPSPLTGTYEASWLSFCADFVQNYCFMHAPRMSMNEANKMAEPGNSFRRAFYHTAEAITDTENIPESIVAGRMEEMLSWLDEYRIFFALKQHTGLAIKSANSLQQTYHKTGILRRWRLNWVCRPPP